MEIDRSGAGPILAPPGHPCLKLFANCLVHPVPSGILYSSGHLVKTSVPRKIIDSEHVLESAPVGKDHHLLLAGGLA